MHAERLPRKASSGVLAFQGMQMASFRKDDPVSMAFVHTFNAAQVIPKVGLFGNILLTRIACDGESSLGVVSIFDADLCHQLTCSSAELNKARILCAEHGFLDFFPGTPSLYRLLVPDGARELFWANVQDQLSRMVTD